MNAAGGGAVSAGMCEVDIPDDGFLETANGRFLPERSEDWERCRAAYEGDNGPVLMVVYHDITPGVWRPFSTFTGKPTSGRGWGGQWDAQYSKRHGYVYVHNSGNADPYLHRYCKPDPPPARVWIAPGVKVRGEMGKKALSDADILALGFQRIDGSPPSPFADGMDGMDGLHWVESADDWLTDEDVFDCCKCGEYEDRNNRGALFVVFDAQEAGLDSEPGIYQVTRWPFYIDGMISHSLIESSLQRLGELPAGLKQRNYACEFLCVACSVKVRMKQERRAKMRRAA